MDIDQAADTGRGIISKGLENNVNVFIPLPMIPLPFTSALSPLPLLSPVKIFSSCVESLRLCALALCVDFSYWFGVKGIRRPAK
jgi:hypothetical protein